MPHPAPEPELPSWHDDTIYGIRFEIGDPDHDQWHSDLVLDIDHIVAWEPGPKAVRFRVAPATLSFHDVTDVRLGIDFGDSGCQIAPSELAIDGISRSLVEAAKICLDRPYYRWRIALNLPRDGEITFGASGYTQTLRATPRLFDRQRLSPAERR